MRHFLQNFPAGLIETISGLVLRLAWLDSPDGTAVFCHLPCNSPDENERRSCASRHLPRAFDCGGDVYRFTCPSGVVNCWVPINEAGAVVGIAYVQDAAVGEAVESAASILPLLVRYAEEAAAAAERPGETAVLDRLLLAAVARGVRHALWTLWERHRVRLLAICRREMQGTNEEAEDALAEVLIAFAQRVEEHAASIRDPAAWLNRFAKHVCADLRRAAQRRRRLAVHYVDATTVSGDAPAALPDIGDAVARLPESLRAVATLRLVEGLSYREIGDRLDLTAANGRKRIQLARAALRGQAVPARGQREYGDAVAFDEHGAVSRVVVVDGTRLHLYHGRKPRREQQKISTLRANVEAHPSGSRNRLALADLLCATGAWIEALDHYLRLLAKRRMDAAVAVRAATMMHLLGRDVPAAALCERTAKEARSGLERLHLTALGAFFAGNDEVARDAFEEALAHAPENAAVRHARIAWLSASGSPASTLAAIDELLARWPEDLVALGCGHELLLDCGRREDAIARAARLLRRSPRDALASSRLPQRKHGGELFLPVRETFFVFP